MDLYGPIFCPSVRVSECLEKDVELMFPHGILRIIDPYLEVWFVCCNYKREVVTISGALFKIISCSLQLGRDYENL